MFCVAYTPASPMEIEVNIIIRELDKYATLGEAIFVGFESEIAKDFSKTLLDASEMSGNPYDSRVLFR